MQKAKIKNSGKINGRVITYSILAIVCLVLMFVIDWLFIVPAVFLVWLNQKELFPKK